MSGPLSPRELYALASAQASADGWGAPGWTSRALARRLSDLGRPACRAAVEARVEDLVWAGVVLPACRAGAGPLWALTREGRATVALFSTALSCAYPPGAGGPR